MIFLLLFIRTKILKECKIGIAKFSKNVEVFLAGSSNRYPKKHLPEKVFTTIKMIGNWMLSFKSEEETTLKWILSGYIKKNSKQLES